jgi:hypothetical protein
MTVLLTVSETVTGSEVSDSLAGGSTGLDLGQVVNGQYTPITSQVANTGKQDLYISHDATIDPITNVKFYVAQYSGTYGGANTAAADITTLLALGAANSGADKNNVDGLSRGLHIDMDWQVSTANQFDPTREATGQKRIFGKDAGGGIDGSSLANAFTMHADAASYWNGSSEVDASAPVTGKIGKSSDSVLGNRGHILARFYLNSGAVDGGILQWDTVVAYSFTA